MEHVRPINVDSSGEILKATKKIGAEEKEGLELICKENFVDNKLHGDSLNTRHIVINNTWDQEVDAVGLSDVECVYSKKIVNDPNETEESSSFGNTFSGSDEESLMSSTDMEVNSQFSAENVEQAVSDGFHRLSKRKRVTDHWRSYISPLLWRCQWLELRMNELRSQALSYEKELSSYRREKQLHLKTIELDGSVSRAIPFCRKHRKRAMKRKRRKRTEDKVDVSSYMSNHNVFSYYENKRPEADCQPVDNEDENQDEDVDKIQVYEGLLQRLRSDDNSLEDMILNFDSLQSRVLGLKTQLGEVINKNSINIHSSDVANKSCTRRTLSFSSKNNGDAVPSLTASDNELDVSGSAVSSYGDAVDNATNDAPFHIGYVKTEAIDDFSHGSPVELKVTKDEEALSCSEDAKISPTEIENESAPPIKRPYTGKRRGRKPKRVPKRAPKRARRGNPRNDGGNLYLYKRYGS